MVTLLGTAGSSLLQVMGMLPTLVSRSFSPSTQKALDWNRVLGQLLRFLKRGARTLPWRLPFRQPHQARKPLSRSLRDCWRGTLATSASHALSAVRLAWLMQRF